MTPTTTRLDTANRANRANPGQPAHGRRPPATAILLVGLAAASALVIWLRPHAHPLPAATMTATTIPAAKPFTASSAPPIAPPPVPLDVTLPARFAFNHATPHGDAAVLAAIADRCLGEIMLVGHADEIGSERANLDIARARAAAVRALLAARGLDAARVRIESAGAHAPIARNDTAAGRRQNRRVTLSCATHPGGEP